MNPQTNPNQPTTQQFLSLFWRPGEIAFTGSRDPRRAPMPDGSRPFSATPADDPRHAAALLTRQAGSHDTWFTPAIFNERMYQRKDGKLRGARIKANMVGARAWWADIDVGPSKPYATREEALQALIVAVQARQLPLPTAIIGSGGGLHVYWVVDALIPKNRWEALAHALVTALSSAGLRADWGCTTDNVRWLRALGTLNHKTTPPRPVEIVQTNPIIALLVIENALRPFEPKQANSASSPSALTPPGNFESEIAEFSEIGALGTVDMEPHWVRVLFGIKRTYKDDLEKALELADTLSRNADKYEGRDAVEDKMKREVEHAGPTIDLARIWARTDAIDIITRAFAGAADNVVLFPDPGSLPDVFKNEKVDASHYLEGIEISGRARSEDNKHLRTDPASVRRATVYLARWWPPKWIDDLRTRYPLDKALIEQCKVEHALRARAEMVANREVVEWDPTHAGRGVAAVADGIVTYARKSGLVWSDGNALWKIIDSGARAMPIVNKEDVDALTNETICQEFRFQNDAEEWQTVFRSFDFKPSTSGTSGPNHIRLLGALKLVVRDAPRCKGFIKQPVLAALPRSYSNLGEPRIIDKPGFDQASGLYLLRGGITVTVPLKFEEAAFRRARALIDSLIGDFNYANDASRVGAWAAMLIAGTRGTLENAPHIGLRTPYEGQGGGKSTKSETYIAVAADGNPAERSMDLGKDINETGTMIFRHLLERPEALGINNIDFDDGREFRSPQLLDLATNGHIGGKLLYSNKAGSMTARPLIVLSGNELRLDMHLVRRTLMLELLRPDEAAPRKIRVPNPQKYVMAHRSEVVAAILTLITAYWDVCREAGGRPKQIEHLCKGRTSTFADPGVDFLLDAATCLTGGRWGSAYDAFDTGKEKSASYTNTREGLALVERVIATHMGVAPPGSPATMGVARQHPVSQTHPATADEIWSAFQASPVDRIAMGEILNRRRGRPDWGSKSLADWLSARVGLNRGPGVPRLEMDDIAKRRGWWFA